MSLHSKGISFDRVTFAKRGLQFFELGRPYNVVHMNIQDSIIKVLTSNDREKEQCFKGFDTFYESTQDSYKTLPKS